MISQTLQHFLDNSRVAYDLVSHPRAYTSMETAAAAHVRGEQLAKSVLIEDEDHYMLVVIPSTHRLELSALHERIGHHVGLATEEAVKTLFDDCETGSIPPFGQAYGLSVMVDDSLLDCDEIYFEGGDHSQLVHMAGDKFRELMDESEHGLFAQHV